MNYSNAAYVFFMTLRLNRCPAPINGLFDSAFKAHTTKGSDVSETI